MWELDHNEGWAPKNWCFLIVVLEKTPESPLDSREIKSVNPKGNQPCIFIISAEAETPILWPPKYCEEPTHWKRSWRWETVKAKEGSSRGWNGWAASPTSGREFEQTLEIVEDRGAWCAIVHGATNWWTVLCDWIITMTKKQDQTRVFCPSAESWSTSTSVSILCPILSTRGPRWQAITLKRWWIWIFYLLSHLVKTYNIAFHKSFSLKHFVWGHACLNVFSLWFGLWPSFMNNLALRDPSEWGHSDGKWAAV